jgi:hypothetical protein
VVNRAEGGDTRALEEWLVRVRGLRLRDELDRAAVEAVTALRSVGVEAMLLKGPALVRELYSDADIRGYSDVDLLVARRDLPDTEEVLTRLGYDTPEDVLGIDDVGGIQHSELWVRASERGGPLLLDLHWKLDGCEAPDDLVWEALSAGRDSLDLAGSSVPVLDTGGLALHVALHAAQHGPQDTKAIGDLARAIELWEPDVWRAAARLAETVQAAPAFSAGLRLLPSGASMARELGLPPAPELEWQILNRTSRPRGTFHLQAIARATGFREHIDVLRRSLLPKRRWIETEFPWARRSTPLLLLAYARHVLRAPIWAARAWRFRTDARRAGGRR